MSNNDIEKAREAQRAYARNWRAKNKERVRANNLRYWLRRAEREAIEQAEQEKGAENNG